MSKLAINNLLTVEIPSYRVFTPHIERVLQVRQVYNINTFFLPAIHSLNMATDARGIACDVTPGQSASVKLIDEVLHLLVGEVTQLTIEVVVRAVMVRSSEPQVIVAVNIPRTVVTLWVIETVSNVTRFKHLVAHRPSIPAS